MLLLGQILIMKTMRFPSTTAHLWLTIISDHHLHYIETKEKDVTQVGAQELTPVLLKAARHEQIA